MGKLDVVKKLTEKLRLIMKRGELVKLALAVIALMLLSGVISGLIVANVRSLYQTSSTISSVGTFKAIGIGAYWDAEATSKVSTLDWGLLTSGSQKSFTVYFKNEGSLPLTLSMSVSNWNPQAASNYLTVSWSYTGQTISTGKSVPVTITLTVSGSVAGIDSFNFDITAVGTYND